MLRFPSLITIHDYARPLKAAVNVIECIKEKATCEDTDQLTLQGHFVLCFSTFEAMMQTTLVAHLMENPDRLEGEVMIAREMIATNYSVRPLLADLVNRHIKQLTYKKPEDEFRVFCDILTIPNFMTAERFTQFDKLRKRRNEIVHRGFDLPGSYLDRSDNDADGPFGRLKVTSTDLGKCANHLLEVVEALRLSIDQRFAGLTRLSVLREVWKFMLGSNVLVSFEDVWQVDEVNDEVVGCIAPDDVMTRFSGAEAIMYQVWLAHYRRETVNLHMRSLDRKRTQQLIWFLEAMQRVWVY